MNVLYLTKYSRKGASSRMRSYQYFPFLEENDVKVTVRPLFDDNYIENLYAGRTAYSQVAYSYFKRFLVLLSVHRYSTVVIEKELFPYLPSWFERILKLLGVKYIVDYDDAIFHNYDLSKNWLIRFFLSSKIDNVMRSSHHVIAGNKYLAQRATKAGAHKISIIPTVIDINRYRLKSNKSNDKIVVGWIGTKSTYEKHYSQCMPIIKHFLNSGNIIFDIVGVNNDHTALPNMKLHKWSESTEVESILEFDIGIMPLTDSPWEQGKCSYKLIQYMGCGIPVICSPIGMNNEVVSDGANGFKATTVDDWIRSLDKLIENPTMREEMGHIGRRVVEEKYSLQINAPRLLKIFNE